jgi:signal transduction histidine kinase
MLLKILNNFFSVLPKTLLGRLIIFPSITIIFMFVTTASVVIYFQYQSLHQSLLRHGSNLGKEVAYSVQSYLLLGDYAAIESVMGRFIESDNIISIALINPNGEVLIKIDKDSGGHVVKSYTLGKSPFSLNSNKNFYIEGQRTVGLFSSIDLADTIWWVRIDISKSEMYSTLMDFVSFGGLLVFLFLIILSLIVVKILHKPVNDIGSLTLFASKLSEDFGAKINVNTQINEIQALSESLNALSQKLYDNQGIMVQQQQNLQQFNDSLWKMVEEETSKNRQKDALLIQQSRFAALGEMIGKIAHQWRQPLNAIALRVQDINLAYHLNELNTDVLNEHVTEVMHDIEGLSLTIDNFSNFVLSKTIDEPYNVHDTVVQTLSLMSSVFIESNIYLDIVTMDKSIISKSGSVQGLGQVLITLFTNSKDALISKADSLKKISIILERVGPGRIQLKISDNGGGVDIENFEKIFDPYFTTKHQSHGTGLGLYIAKNIVENEMGGFLRAHAIESGICFIVEWES